jgi:mannose/fructose/N-acetylgalactosamine-specific phosphotransferase system component IIC
MSEKVFDRETLLDLTVNVIPFAIMAIFFALFLVFNPFEGSIVITAIQLSIVGVSAIGLMILTYYSGAAVSKAEEETEAKLEGETAEQAQLEGGDEPAALNGDEDTDEE